REDLTLEELQWRAGIEAELLARDLAARLVDVERIRVPTGPVQREHELAAKTLAQRMRSDQTLKLGDERRVPAEIELGLYALFERRGTQLVQACDGRSREGFVPELREGVAAPECERLADPLEPFRRVACIPCLGEGGLGP